MNLIKKEIKFLGDKIFSKLIFSRMIKLTIKFVIENHSAFDYALYVLMIAFTTARYTRNNGRAS